ncbi:MAG TPA: nucleotidyltransferase family protein [Geobacterales bacterium]|nr:nucleotidyltransferase family protein [Geobacterales bacterium]
MEAVILAAGIGKRMKPLSYVFPKPLLRLGDKTVIDHIINWLLSNNIKDIKIVLSDVGRLVELYLKEKYESLSFYYSKPLGTAGQLNAVKNHISSSFLITYADVVTNFNIKPMFDFHLSNKSVFTIALKEIQIPIRYGVISHDKTGKVNSWEEKPNIEIAINAGIYIAEPEIFNYIKEEPSPMNDLVKTLLKEKKPVYAYHITGELFDIGNMEDYERANKIFEERLGNI